MHIAHLTPGLRESQWKRRNQEFESTIGRNTNGSTGENENIASQPTQSCVVDNGKLLANLYYIISDKLITKLCFNVVYIKVSRKPILRPTEHRNLVMKGVLRHNHLWLMSLILCHHAICTDTPVKVCVHDVHALPVHIVHIHLCLSHHSRHMWVLRWWWEHHIWWGRGRGWRVSFCGTRYTSLLLSHVKISLKPTYSTLDLC
jgi:hypothetical protein